jgi:hypothetical protein
MRKGGKGIWARTEIQVKNIRILVRTSEKHLDAIGRDMLDCYILFLVFEEGHNVFS